MPDKTFLARKQAHLLDILSGYFGHQGNISLQSICDDINTFTGSSFAMINLFKGENASLKTEALSYKVADYLHRDKIIDLLHTNWNENSFIYHTTKVTKLASAKEVAGNNEELYKESKALFDSFNIYTIRLPGSETLGSVIIGLRPSVDLTCIELIEYLVQQIAKTIPMIEYTTAKSEKLFEMREKIYEHDTDLIFVVDLELNITETNAKKNPGDSLPLGTSILGFVPTHFHKTFSGFIANSIKSDDILYEAVPLAIGKQPERFHTVKFVPIKKNGKVDRVCIIATDILEMQHLMRDFNTVQKVATIGWWELFQRENKLTFR
jgi:hypothetical protein